MRGESRDRQAQWAAWALLALAVILGAVLTTAPRRAMLGFTLLAGVGASGWIARFGWARRRRARALIGSARIAPGRIVEGTQTNGRVLLDLPGGIEPWAHDGWVLFVTTLGAVWLASMAESASRLPLWLVAVVIGLMGLRLLAVASDRIRFELEKDAWSVEAFEAGRAIRRAGRGALCPELTADGVILWSVSGRVGTLGRELEPAEGRWFAERLKTHFPACRPSTEPRDGELNQQETGDEGQRYQ